MKTGEEFFGKLNIVEDEMLKLLMEKIEYHEVTVIFERFRDFFDEIEVTKDKIKSMDLL